MTHPRRDDFKEAADREMKSLWTMGTFEEVDRPAKTQVLPVTWVFKYKFNESGALSSFKARLCVRGDLQVISIDETYSATLRARSFQTIMALTAAFNLETWQADAVNTFVNSDLDEVVYIEVPDGYASEKKKSIA